MQQRIGELEKTLADTKSEFGQVRAEIAKRTRPATAPSIADHALLRFMERALGFDIDGLREQILTPAVKAAISAGASCVTVDGFKMIVENNKIVTVVDKQKPKAKTLKPYERDTVYP